MGACCRSRHCRVVLMAVAANYIAKLLARLPWITWIGLLIILYVAIDMMWRGSLSSPALMGQLRFVTKV